MNRAFWSGRRVFLTGHTGFKGSWLTLWLQSLGAEVHGYALAPPTEPSLFDLAQVAPLLASDTRGDVRDLTALSDALRHAQPEIVIHMAAQPLVREAYRTPVETYSVNVMGSVHLLESVRHTPSVRAVVNVTTDKCYENREWLWGYREDEAMGGYDPYSSSKGCAELVTSAYRRSYFSEEGASAVASARAGNVIGGGDWAAERLVPDILRALLAGRPVAIRSPASIRPWQHVLEPLSGYLMLAERLCASDGIVYAGSWNFGPRDEDARPVEWIVRRLCRLWGKGADFTVDTGVHPHEAHYLKLDCSKSQQQLGWAPCWDLNTALTAIVAWTRCYQSKGDLRSCCLEQITSYEESRRDDDE